MTARVTVQLVITLQLPVHTVHGWNCWPLQVGTCQGLLFFFFFFCVFPPRSMSHYGHKMTIQGYDRTCHVYRRIVHYMSAIGTILYSRYRHITLTHAEPITFASFMVSHSSSHFSSALAVHPLHLYTIVGVYIHMQTALCKTRLID